MGTRSFASQLFALGRSAEHVVLNAWDAREDGHGRGFPALELQRLSLVEQLNQLTEQHRAYPMLHYYHAAGERNSAPAAVVVPHDALTLLRWGVAPECRPAPAALRVAQEAVRGYLDTVRSAHVEPADAEPAPPDPGRVRDAGIPVAPADEFTAAEHEHGEPQAAHAPEGGRPPITRRGRTAERARRSLRAPDDAGRRPVRAIWPGPA